MTSPLTGDFDAVLQVASGTIDRLLGTMHQRGGAPNPGPLPRLPHAAIVRVGDPDPVDGLRGTAYAQISVPRIELIDGATDRFRLEVYVRAHYRSDLGWTPLPAFIDGRVTAEYRLSAIDPACPGYQGVARDFVWFRVVESSVAFTGTAVDDPPAVAAPNPQQTNRRIVRALRRLLATTYAPAPHRIAGAEFRAGSMISLSTAAGSAVALPVGTHAAPNPQISSIRNVLLDGAQMAVGVRVEAITAMLAPFLDAVEAYAVSVPVHVDTPWPAPDIDTVYRVRMSRPTVEWRPQDTTAILKLRVSGSAKTDSILPDATFGIEQDVVLSFDGTQQRLWVTPGSRIVAVDVSTVIGAGTIRDAVRANINAAVGPMVDAACAQAQPKLDAMLAQRQRLEQELRRLDETASVLFRSARFTPDGLVLRGTISLSRYAWPIVGFLPMSAWRALVAMPSWIPAGRVTRFEWAWSWPGGIHPDGAATYDDRFLLRRLHEIAAGRFGARAGLADPLPAIDGPGRICLRISGFQVRPSDGGMVQVGSDWQCAQFGPAVGIAASAGARLLLRETHAGHEVALVEAAAPAGEATANTLVIYAEDDLGDDTVATLREGLAASTRDDAGLAVFVLFPDGRLAGVAARTEADPARRLRDVADELPAPVLVNEDVVGAWSEQLGLRSPDPGPAWCLVAATGGVAWMHRGPLSGQELARALDACLFASPPPGVYPADPSIAVGAAFEARALAASAGDAPPSCPPPPVGRHPSGISIVSFVRHDSAASHAALRRLTRVQDERDGALGVLVVDGRDADAAFGASYGDWVTIPDPDGAVAARFGIRAWPTTIVVDESGTVAAVEVGIDPRREEAAR